MMSHSMAFGIGGGKLISMTFHVNQVAGRRIIDVCACIRVIPFESQDIFINRIPIEHGGVGFELVALEKDFRSFIIGDEVALTCLEVDVRVVIIG